MAKTLKPTFANVIIRPIESEDKTPAGLILPDSGKERPLIGEIVAVGPGRKNDAGQLMPMVVKPGQKVSYKKWGGVKIEFEKEIFVVMDQKELLAIIG